MGGMRSGPGRKYSPCRRRSGTFQGPVAAWNSAACADGATAPPLFAVTGLVFFISLPKEHTIHLSEIPVRILQDFVGEGDVSYGTHGCAATKIILCGDQIESSQKQTQTQM